MLFGICSF